MIKVPQPKHSGGIALVDGDLVIYNIGFSCYHNIYFVGDQEFRYKADAHQHLDDIGKADHSVIGSRVADVEDYIVKGRLNNLIYDNILFNNDTEEYIVYIGNSGSLNYRYNIAKTIPYKGNRLPQPEWYQKVRIMLVDGYDTEVVKGIEVDDKLGIEHTKNIDGSFICTRDKDLEMIPGHHYNWKTKKRYYISELKGIRNFYKQMLLGDTSDNIEGVYGCGTKGAEKILSKCKTEGQMQRAVFKIYEDAFGSEARRRFKENAQLLWIQREPNDYLKFKELKL